VEAKPGFNSKLAAKPFALQAPPIRIHAAPTTTTPAPNTRSITPEKTENRIEHAPKAPGEQTYDAVPIPGAYASPVQSPGFAPGPYGSLGMAVTSDKRIESPPASPRRW